MAQATGASTSKTTKDHSIIKRWVEERNGTPAKVKGTEKNEGGIGVLRVKFSEDPDLETISWEDFFETFDERNLKFLYQEKKESTFHKFID